MRRTLLIALLLLTVPAAVAHASLAPKPWPPAAGPGQLFVHFGEEHYNDDDGGTLFPKVVAESARYRPELVTTSGDKDNDGTVEQLSAWKQIMSAYDREKVPYLPGIGNHDRTTPPGAPPGTAGLLTPGVQGSITNYKEIFKDRPYPFGDAASYPGIGPQRPNGEPAGASTHYFADVGRVRWIFLDNSCWGLTDCDSVQSPGFPDPQGNTTQLGFLERNAKEASDQGRTVFVVMHMPTRDPRDQSYIDPTTFNHTMGKGDLGTGAPDNERFELAAERSGVDGVFLGHIKGQFLYRGRGNVPYYIDGGGGGELYTEGPVGTDHGYWHGFRLVRVSDGGITTDMVPIFVPEGIRLEGPEQLQPGDTARYEAFGRQPVFKDPAKVDALELRDPDPVRPAGSSSMGAVGGFLRDGGWVMLPLALLVLGGLVMTARLSRTQRRGLALGCAAVGASITGAAGMAMAQRSAPTTTPKESLPVPARIFATSDSLVFSPVPSASDDPRRNLRTQTEDGEFLARCPGSARVRITSGYESTARTVRMPSSQGPILRSAELPRVRALRPGSRRTVARIRLAQRAVIIVRVRRGGRTVRTLRRSCRRPGSSALNVAWDGRVGRPGRLRAGSPGRYSVQLTVRSDRKPVRRLGRVNLLRRR